MADFDFDEIAQRIRPDELGQFLNLTEKGSGYLCPLHDDSDPSFSIFRRDGRTGWKCHACERSGTPVELASEIWGVDLPRAAERLGNLIGLRPSENGGRSGRIVATYDYADAEGTVLFQVVRKEGKRFLQRRPNGDGGWRWNLKGVDPVLYRLPEVLAAKESGERIYVVEGEKDVHALEEAGVVATCNPGGAGKWKPRYAEALNGADVTIVADADEAGRKHARQVGQSLFGVANSIRVVEPASGSDAADHLAAGHGLDDFTPFQQPTSEPSEPSEPKRERRTERRDEGVTEIRLMPHREYGAKYSTDDGSDWTVANWLPLLGFGTVVGPPEVYKSWLLYDLAFSVASGLPFLGRYEVERSGPVIIFQLEDRNQSVMSRLNLIEVFRRGYRVPHESGDPDVLAGPLPLDLPIYHFEEFGLDLKPRTVDLICERILEVDARLVIFDPLFTLGEAEDEYFRRMADQIQPLKQRQEELECAFQFGHHSKKNDEAENSTRRSRTFGSQFLDASKNFDWQVRKTGDASIVLKRYFKHDATEGEVQIDFDINTDPERGPWRYDVAVEKKRGTGPYGDPPVHEEDLRTEESIRLAIYEYIAAHPGCTWTSVRESFPTRTMDLMEHRRWLEENDHIENRGTSNQHAWYATDEPYLPEMGPDEGETQ